MQALSESMADAHSNFRLSAASDVLGAEIRGIDLSAPLQTFQAKSQGQAPSAIQGQAPSELGQAPSGIRGQAPVNLGQALRDHHLLIFPDQVLEPRDLVRIARVFGELTRYPFLRALPDEPLVAPVVKEPWDSGVFGGGWHTDTPYLPEPAKATLLYALEVPESGGDTLFSNMQLAFRDLPTTLKERVMPMHGVFTSARVHSQSGNYSGSAGREQDRAEAPAFEGAQAVHPLVRRHADTGALSLYVSPLHLSGIVGMPDNESAPVIEQLSAHATEEQYRFRLKWRPGTLAVWDNRCLLHCPLDDYDGQRRVMLRVSIKGERPKALRTG